jgi:hypothetical protein
MKCKKKYHIYTDMFSLFFSLPDVTVPIGYGEKRRIKKVILMLKLNLCPTMIFLFYSCIFLDIFSNGRLTNKVSTEQVNFREFLGVK